MSQEVTEGGQALVNMQILFGELKRNVSVALSTVDGNAEGIVKGLTTAVGMYMYILISYLV